MNFKTPSRGDFWYHERTMEIRFFNQEIEQFIASLEKATIAKVLRTFDLLEMFGHRLGMPHSKKVGDEVT